MPNSTKVTFYNKPKSIKFSPLSGKRICPGEVLAQRELFLFVTQLVQTFDMQPAEGVIAKSMNSDGVYDGVGFFPPEFEARFLTL